MEVLSLRGQLEHVRDPRYRQDLEQRLAEAPRYPCSTRPVPVDGAPSLVRVEAGGARTCGLTAAGELYCWGVLEDLWVEGERRGTPRPARIGG
jgi:hypothetical protein